MKSLAAILEKPGKPFVMDTIDVDSPKDDEVMVKIVASGVCGTDFFFQGPSPLSLPTVLGHEGSGYVVEVGKNVKNVKVGDGVMIAGTFCGECEECRKGRSHLCTFNIEPSGMMQDGTFRYHRKDQNVSSMFCQGTFKEYTIVHKNAVTKAPEEVDIHALAPLGCGMKTGAGAVFNTLDVKKDTSIVVMGCGPVGLSAIMAAKISACKEILCFDVFDSRLELAKEMGATHAINSKETDPVEAVMEIVPGGVDYVVEATGIIPLIEAGMKMLKRGGEITIVGNPRGNLLDFLGDFLQKGTTVKAHFGAGGPTPILLSQLVDYYARGMFPFDKMITYYDFKDIEQAFEDAKSGKVIKAVLRLDN